MEMMSFVVATTPVDRSPSLTPRRRALDTHHERASPSPDRSSHPRGRPRGSKDRAARKQRGEPIDLTRCKMDLLKIMLYTKDLAQVL